MESSPLALALSTCFDFELGCPDGLTITNLPGCANRLWRVDLSLGSFVLKEFRYTPKDLQWLASVRRAAEFEYEMWLSNVIPMAEPIRNRNGELLAVVRGSRGTPSLIRVHRWFAGARISWPLDVATGALAGRQVAAIQQKGAALRGNVRGSLLWWRWQPFDILERLRHRRLIDADLARRGRKLIESTYRLVEEGQRTDGPWSMSHLDHKPSNVLSTDGGLCVLDWDESAPCHPRLEGVESALLWAGIDRGLLSEDLFMAYLAAYSAARGDAAGLSRPDFAKYAAGLIGWFDYQGRRALREFDDDDDEATAAVGASEAALAAIELLFDRVDAWCTLIRT